jgi:hypothetical protein
MLLFILSMEPHSPRQAGEFGFTNGGVWKYDNPGK